MVEGEPSREPSSPAEGRGDSGPPPTTVARDVPVDVRLFRTLATIAAGVLLLVVVPSNLLVDLPAAVNVISGVLGLTFAALVAISRRGRHLIRTFCLLVVLSLNVLFFLNGGAAGSVMGWFLVAVPLVALLFRGRARVVVLAALAADGVALPWIERWRPEWVIPFSSDLERLLDLSTGLVGAMLGAALLVGAVVHAWRVERDRLTAANAALEHSLAEVRTLRGLLPICGWCKHIHTEDDRWISLDGYVASRTDAAFTHGICPKCMEKHFGPELAGDQTR